MKKRKIIKTICQFMFALLITAFLTKLILGGSTSTAYAAIQETGTGSSTGDDGSLATPAGQEEMVESLGLSSEQPARYSESGDEIDKSENPLGADNVFVNRNYQLTLSYITGSGSTLNDQLNVYNNPIGTGTITLSNNVAANMSNNAKFFAASYKKEVALDIDNDGKQEVATVGYVSNNGTYSIQLYISDFDTLTSTFAPTTTSSIYTVASGLTIPYDKDNPYSTDALKCAAGDLNKDGVDEIIIASGQKLYIGSVTMKNYTELSSKGFSYAIDDIDALDSNGDGFPDLLVTVHGKLHGTVPMSSAMLMIYNGIVLTKPAYSISLAGFYSASVDIGDLLGDGDDTIAIGGLNFLNKPEITYVKYDPETESYSTNLAKVYAITDINVNAIKSMYDIKCASLMTPVDGTAEYVVLGGFIFQYDTSTDVFKQQTITTYSSQYQFQWALAAYNYDLTAGDDTQRCTVINYICKPVGTDFPPTIPANLKVSEQVIDSNTLTWSVADGASGYKVWRAISENGVYSCIATINGKGTASYKDQKIERNKDYYYKIQAYNNKATILKEPLAVTGLQVNEIRIVTQPKLIYKEYDPLDLSSLKVSLVLAGDKSIDVAYADFAKYLITTSMDNGIQLESINAGTPITITYGEHLSTNTNNLTVKANGIYPIDLAVNFTVGNVTNASALVSNKTLSAGMNMENTSSTKLSVLVTLALYDANGSMVAYSTKAVDIAANGKQTCSCSLSGSLPSEISGYTAKVFVWDGKDLLSSNMTPLADMAEIS